MTSVLPRCAVVGHGRLGTALSAALRASGVPVDGPLGRGATGAGADVVLLCVPDAEIAVAAACIPGDRLVGHCSGATTLGPLSAHRHAFSLHPLMTVTAAGADFAGASAAIAGTTERARATARDLALALGMEPFAVADEDRAAYHAAASVASNFLVTLEWAAERIGGIDRAALAPLIRAAVDNWEAQGPRAALTGPIAGGDRAVRSGRHRRHPRRHPAGRRMRTLRTVAELRAALAPARRDGRTIALVPTMGFLHEGHLSLIAAAREQADEVVVSLFVNPAQFDEASDLEAYPRDEARDAGLAAAAGADLLFAPPVEEIYPAGFATQVRVQGPLTEQLEGAHRGAAHFHGVTTVVTKLLNMVGPDVALFGQKDAQQTLVIRRLATDLDLPVRIEVAPTVREEDGLARSSRNVRLTGDDRRRALALSSALRAAEQALAAGTDDAATLIAAARAAMDDFDVEPEYLALVDPEDLRPVATVDQETLLAVAARVGQVRLIDNTVLSPELHHRRGRADGDPPLVAGVNRTGPQEA
jgi:pantoate--beta-alanine ligase